MKLRLGGVLGALAFGCLVFAGEPARAEEKARLTYVRGSGTVSCPGEMDLRLWVLARLGYDPFSPQASRVVLARLESINERALRGSVELIDEQGVSSGRRELSAQAGRCDELARAMALSISLAIDPERASQPRPAQVAAQPSRAPAAPEAPPPPPLPRLSEPRWFTTLAVTSNVGALPALALGGTASIGVTLPPLTLAVEGRLLQSPERDLAPHGKLSGSLMGAGVAACTGLGRLGLCGVTLLAFERLTASEVSQARARSALFASLGPRVTWRFPLTRSFSFGLGLEALFDVSRNSATISGAEVWKAPLVSGGLSAGIEALFL